MTALISNIATVLSHAAAHIQQLLTNIILYIRYFFIWSAGEDSGFSDIFMVIIRWIMPILALFILLSVFRSMLRVRSPDETWGYLESPELGRFPIRHWECILGRARHCDIIVKQPTVSRTQCALIRNDKGVWTIHDLGGRKTTEVDGSIVQSKTILPPNSTLSIGGIQFFFHPITTEELAIQKRRRLSSGRPVSPRSSFIALTLFQLLTIVEFSITRPDRIPVIALSFVILSAVMWSYYALTRRLGQTGFEPEILAFFACTLNLAVTATSTPGTMLKQTIAIVLGIIGFMLLGWYLRNLNRVVRTRFVMAGLAIALFVVNILFAEEENGARNWIEISGVSLQPSEIAKLCFIFAGAAALDRLFAKRNLFGFMALSGFCLLALAITGDFGTATIFFVVFLVIAFMRSGDLATLALICGAAVGAALIAIRFKPYIANRFAVWGHAWEHPLTTGYQQVRTMSASASGGLIGVGAGKGWLHSTAASNTDLVFGVLCEEWGLIIALLAVFLIVALAVFTVRIVRNGRSSYYVIAACAASSLMVFQTMLNVFGSLDLFPLTGVTFPFISCGGTSMITSWGLLAYIKAADTRQDASFAVRQKSSAESSSVPSSDTPSTEWTETPVSTRPVASKEQRRTRIFSPDQLSFIRKENSSPSQVETTSEEDDIDAFFRQFDEMDSDPARDDFSSHFNEDEFPDETAGTSNRSSDWSDLLQRIEDRENRRRDDR